WLLGRAGFRPEMDRTRDVLAIVFLGALAGMLVSALAGTATLVGFGAVPVQGFAATFSVWWTGDAMDVLIFAPTLLVVRSARRASPGRVVREARAGAGSTRRAGQGMEAETAGPRRPGTGHGRLTGWRRLEAAALFAGLAAVSRLVLWSELPLLCLVFPFLIWASWRFFQWGAAPAA